MKLIIADDERLVRNLIKNIIPYKKYGFELAAEASNGLEALNLCMQHKPEILVTDLRMPGLSGLDLIIKLKESCPDTRVLIISGYSEFEYAKTAMKLGVYDYILKPIDEDEFCEALVGIRNQILKEKTSINNESIKNIPTSDNLSSYIRELVADVLELYGSKEDVNPVDIAKSFLDKNYQLDISLDQLAKYVHLNPTYFSSQFKHQTGYSFVEYRNMLRINHSKELLSVKDMPVNELAEKIGYKDSKYFIKVFKKLTGMTPGEYRSSVANDPAE